ncbi:MAG TPA: carboxypeptidase-like regulatory domain-containing protein [Candidatus Binatia bacterium]|nr:carboxypeptidase-like regulatory domain-containing protein [Candidatus Binatia bacterium]
MKRLTNLRLVFAEKSGAYLVGVSLIVATERGWGIVSTAVNGPWFFVLLPPGSYSITARFATATKTIENVRLVKGKSKQQIFVWHLGEQREP